MTRQMLRAKVHRITVTERDVEYEGSLTLDRSLMDACGMVPFEKVDVYDVENGNRFSTYLIEGEPGSGACCVNGAAARLVERGDHLIVASYCSVAEAEVARHQPRIVRVDERNRLAEVKGHEGPGVRVPGARYTRS
jgi:aspartate 1-decarboxylase